MAIGEAFMLSRRGRWEWVGVGGALFWVVEDKWECVEIILCGWG